VQERQESDGLAAKDGSTPAGESIDGGCALVGRCRFREHGGRWLGVWLDEAETFVSRGRATFGFFHFFGRQLFLSHDSVLLSVESVRENCPLCKSVSNPNALTEKAKRCSTPLGSRIDDGCARLGSSGRRDQRRGWLLVRTQKASICRRCSAFSFLHFFGRHLFLGHVSILL
jgi:hypothetical protein